MIRVRFAPSPTGELHPGNARVAIFNWLFAKHYKGKYILRIEDTDVERSSKEFEEAIYNDLKWIGIDWDEGPYKQTERLERYKEVSDELLERGFLYKCYCTEDELKQMREEQKKKSQPPRYTGRCKNLSAKEKKEYEDSNIPYALRFDVERYIKDSISSYQTYKDEIKGDLSYDLSEIADFVVMKQTGIPTYNLAVVIDDMDMDITHVFRGEDHVSNTFRHIMLFDVLGRSEEKRPKIGHLSMLLSKDRTKLSKRSGGIPIHEYKAMGFLPDAVFNHLAFLGGGLRDVDELADRSELIKSFNYKNTGASPCVYDIDKLRSVNGRMLQKIESSKLLEILEHDQDLKTDWTNNYSKNEFFKIIELLKDGAKTNTDITRDLNIFLVSDVDKTLYGDFSKDQRELLKFIKDLYTSQRLTDWKKLKDIIASNTTLKGAELFKTIRLIVTGRKHGPPLDNIMNLINPDVIIDRLVRIGRVID